MAPDDVKYLFIHFMIMVAIGVPPRLHFHETGRTFSGIRFPDQVTPHPPTAEELAALRPLVERWCALFGGDAEALMDGPFTVVTPDSKNPYRQMYAAN